MEEQLDVDDSDIFKLLHFEAAQGQRRPLNECDIQHHASEPSSSQLSGSSRPSAMPEAVCSNPASSIFSRLQRRPGVLRVQEEESQDLPCKVINQSTNCCMIGPSKKRPCDMQAYPENGMKGLKLVADKEISSDTSLLNVDMREERTLQTSNSPGHYSQGQPRTLAESQMDRILSSQVKKNIALLLFKIPGPAGSVQMACLPKSHHLIEAFTSKPNVISLDSHTQPREAKLDIADFKSSSWLAALDYLRQRRGCDLISTISSIKAFRIDNRIRKLLTIIKSCVPNGSGDVVVTLADDSGLIGGIINRNVMAETEFGRDIEPGAVIILHEVAVFSPVPYAHYLNITINNVEHVFRKELNPVANLDEPSK